MGLMPLVRFQSLAIRAVGGALCEAVVKQTLGWFWGVWVPVTGVD